MGETTINGKEEGKEKKKKKVEEKNKNEETQNWKTSTRWERKKKKRNNKSRNGVSGRTDVLVSGTVYRGFLLSTKWRAPQNENNNLRREKVRRFGWYFFFFFFFEVLLFSFFNWKYRKEGDRGPFEIHRRYTDDVSSGHRANSPFRELENGETSRSRRGRAEQLTDRLRVPV